MKKKFPKLIIVFVLALVSLLFSACADVNYTTGKNIEGDIVEQVIATLDTNSLNMTSSQIYNRKTQITNTANSTLENLKRSYLNKINQEILKAESDQNNELKRKYEDLLDDVYFSEPSWQGDIFVVSAKFKSESSYLIFYNLTEKNFSTIQTKPGWLYDKIYYKGNLGYYTNYGLYSSLVNQISPLFPGFNTDDTRLAYSYLTQSRRYHSNADQITHTKDGYLHSWDIEESLDKEIYFYLKIANRQNWYILALTIGLISTAILSVLALIILIIKKIRKRRLIYRILDK